MNALHPAFILHRRRYRETSALLTLLTQTHGRIEVIAKGVHHKAKHLAGLLQPFVPLQVNWVGKRELHTLTTLESKSPPFLLEGMALYCGLYLNELLIRCLTYGDQSYSDLFIDYTRTLNDLSELTESNYSGCLRRFEKRLLFALGYELPLAKVLKSSSGSEPSSLYHYDNEIGFIPLHPGINSKNSRLFSYECLVALAQDDYQNPNLLPGMKKLMRLALAPLLGNKPLKIWQCIPNLMSGDFPK